MCNGLEIRQQRHFLQQFRAGLVESQKLTMVNKIMTILNQCCKEKLKYLSNDPSENRQKNGVAAKQKDVKKVKRVAESPNPTEKPPKKSAHDVSPVLNRNAYVNFIEEESNGNHRSVTSDKGSGLKPSISTIARNAAEKQNSQPGAAAVIHDESSVKQPSFSPRAVPTVASSRSMPASCHGDIPASSRAAKGTASIEQFFWSTLSTDNDSCLSNLERLSNDAEVSPELEAKLTVEMRRLFRNRCVGLFNFYSNPGFLKLHEDAVQALDDYAGKQLPFDEAFLLEQLRQYAFVLTPRMWSRLEILLIMFLLLDPNLHYLNIGQKSAQVEEEMQNR